MFANRFDIVPNETTGTYIIYPRAGLFKVFTPTDEQDFEIMFTDVSGKTFTEDLTVKITGDRHILEFIGVLIGCLLAIALVIYIIIVEVTRIRFPRGAYVKYYTTTQRGKPDTSLSEYIYLNRPSLDKLKNGSYLPIPNTPYKVTGEENFEGLTFEALKSHTDIRINGITGLGTPKTSFVPINKNGGKISVESPVDDDVQEKFMLFPLGHFLRDKQNEQCAEISTKN